MRYGSSTPQVTRSSISTPMYACVAVEHQRLAPEQRQRRVGAGDQPLGGRFFVAGGAVDLPGEVQAADRFRFQRRLQLVGRGVVVLHRVAVAHDLGPLQAGDQAEDRVLHVARQAGRDAVDVDFVRVAAFRLEEHLVPLLVGEAHDLVFDRRTVPRAARLDLAAVHRRTVQVRADQVVHRRIGVRDPAGQLLDVEPIGEKRERLGPVVARLQFDAVVVDRAAVEPRRRAGLEPLESKAQPRQRPADAGGGAFARPAAGRLRLAGVHQRLQERAGGEHDGRRR